MLAWAAKTGKDFLTVDVVSAFLFAPLRLNTTLYAEIPQGHPDYAERETHVLKIERAIYGLRESPGLWFQHLTGVLRELGFKNLIHDECVFLDKSKSVAILTYVDDMLILGEKSLILNASQRISKKLQITKGNVNQESDFLC